MGVHISIVPSLNGQVAPSHSSASPIAGRVAAKERLSKISLLFRHALGLLVDILQLCVKIFVFAAVVLWPWESAW
jgi:hypothetical protein